MLEGVCLCSKVLVLSVTSQGVLYVEVPDGKQVCRDFTSLGIVLFNEACPAFSSCEVKITSLEEGNDSSAHVS